jgi:hypothetical protein
MDWQNRLRLGAGLVPLCIAAFGVDLFGLARWQIGRVVSARGRHLLVSFTHPGLPVGFGLPMCVLFTDSVCIHDV